MRILVTGASGFVGSQLVPRLLSDGHVVVALARDPARVQAALAPHGSPPEAAHGIEIVQGDALTGEGLERALDGVEVAYYLIHSMERRRDASASPERSSQRRDALEPTSIGPFDERERVAADTFARAAGVADVRRIVYLGGLLGRGREDEPASRHLSSRRAVQEILLAAVADSVALRASIVVGARSRSFRFLVHLVERLPVLTLPAWRNFHTQPIDGRDITEMLCACATASVGGRSLDVGGPDVLSYGEMMAQIAELMLVHRPAVGFGVSMTPLTGRLAAAIAGEDPELVLPLMDSLQRDLLPADDHAAELLGVQLHSFDSAVEHALGEWEMTERLAAR
jgi:uncharacterized protein YbjT (DUF2867 family)